MGGSIDGGLERHAYESFTVEKNLIPDGFYGILETRDISKWPQIKHAVAASLKFLFHAMCTLFVPRSHSTAGADQGTVTIQHSFEDPTAAHRDQGRQATSEGDEEGKGVPRHL